MHREVSKRAHGILCSAPQVYTQPLHVVTARSRPRRVTASRTPEFLLTSPAFPQCPLVPRSISFGSSVGKTTLNEAFHSEGYCFFCDVGNHCRRQQGSGKRCRRNFPNLSAPVSWNTSVRRSLPRSTTCYSTGEMGKQ